MSRHQLSKINVRPAAFICVALTGIGEFGLSNANAGTGRIDPDGTVHLTYTTVVADDDTPIQSSDLILIREQLKVTSRYICEATDGMLMIRDWVYDPGARWEDADIWTAPREGYRANSAGTIGGPGHLNMFNLDAATLAHELGHYMMGLPDVYGETRRGGTAAGIGPAFEFPLSELNNTFMQRQSTQARYDANDRAAGGTGFEFQMSYDANFDLVHGNETAANASFEAYPQPEATSEIEIMGGYATTTKPAEVVDLSSVQSAKDSAQAFTAFEIIDEGGDVQWMNMHQDYASAAHGLGCYFGYGSIRAWVFVEWIDGGATATRSDDYYDFIVATEDRQFSGETADCTTPLSEIALTERHRVRVKPALTGCGDGVRITSEECDPSVPGSPVSVSCSALGQFTDPSATTTCDPVTCTWLREGCHRDTNLGSRTCGLQETQCIGNRGDRCPGSGVFSFDRMACTDCLNDPRTCADPPGLPVEVTGSLDFTIPNTEFSRVNRGADEDFPVSLVIGGGAFALLDGPGDSTLWLRADGRGDCKYAVDRWGWCETMDDCEWVCGELYHSASYDETDPNADPDRGWQTTSGKASYLYRAGYSDVRCQNADGTTANEAGCLERKGINGIISEWDILQYRLRNYFSAHGQDGTTSLIHNGVALGSVGDPLTWGQQPPADYAPIVSSGLTECEELEATVEPLMIDPLDISASGVYDTAIALDISYSMALPINGGDSPPTVDLCVWGSCVDTGIPVPYTSRFDVATRGAYAALSQM